MRKKIMFFISFLLLLTVVLCGCQKQTDMQEDDRVLTKSEWAGLLGDRFGYDAYENTGDFYADVHSDDSCYNQIQACAEWGILQETGSFHPDDQVTWLYAIETSVRAIGIEKLNHSNAGIEVTENNLVDFFTSRIVSVDTEALDTQLTGTDAALILAYAYQYAANLTLVEKMEYTYNENVTEAEAGSIRLKGDGMTAESVGGVSYKTGDVIYVKSSEENAAYAMRVNAVSGNEITYVQADLEDVYEELQITGTYEGTVIGIEPANDITVSMVQPQSEQNFLYASYILGQDEQIYDNEEGVILTGLKIDGNNIKFDANLKDGASLNVSISDITVTSDVDFGIFKGLKKADITLSFNDSVVANSGAGHVSGQVPLGTLEVALGATPLTAKFFLVANIGFDGKAALTYTSRVVAMVNYQKGNGLSKSVSNENPNCDFHADATVTVEPCIKVELRCLGRGLANVKVTSGVVAIATADVDLLGNEPSCIDVYMYVPLRWAVNEDGCLMTMISNKLKASAVVWDSGNSPVNVRLHWEDLVLVEACTRGKEKVETECVDAEGQPYDEYKIFDFEELEFGFIKVASQSVHLAKGESVTIGILSVPEGYRIGDLVYQPEDSSVCSADQGQVTAVGSGSTVLRISTPDGKYSVFLTVTVAEEYNDTSGFQSL